ncbi:DNA-directed RNA polymerase subunit delta [Amphibacillus jilinensis]|uniref:DNA-directed RNA polymerase subunit delta n=1 Tax=Amphibacillus jilinensis TaxID=1216008 RepID=UPI00030E7DA1|nr:DNA-directed RNA polymerase subunit delta [Amphibacillus jilinensis]
MSLAELNLDEQQEYSMIELATKILKKENKALNYKDLFDEVAELKSFSQAEKETYIAQFYTDLNLDGRFLTIGSGQWGLKVWYPVEQIDEDITAEPKKKKKKKRKTTKKEVEPSIDETDEDLTEVPLDFVEESYDDDEDEIDLGDDIAEDDVEESYDEDEEDYEEDADEDYEEDEDDDDRK